jgi:hypothetical protein
MLAPNMPVTFVQVSFEKSARTVTPPAASTLALSMYAVVPESGNSDASVPSTPDTTPWPPTALRNPVKVEPSLLPTRFTASEPTPAAPPAPAATIENDTSRVASSASTLTGPAALIPTVLVTLRMCASAMVWIQFNAATPAPEAPPEPDAAAATAKTVGSVVACTVTPPLSDSTVDASMFALISLASRFALTTPAPDAPPAPLPANGSETTAERSAAATWIW